ncbi:hypothetical protein QR680_017480 [Steinernema hermaphroditum]|uniref:Uncharacterized protein n=1 Tax=Steinernema hermaphroditum TaxID=289476 RepID=A0AA39HFY1_9BILA|nr:hypothetical protein QR680_017480 [Steinernema hermaphroditum]
MHRLLLLPLLLLQACSLGVSGQAACADQLQRCGVAIEDFERQIQEMKSAAFKNCFTKPECLKEKMVFDECYAKSVRAVRAPFNDDYSSLANDGFFDSAERYRNHLEQCFAGLPSRASFDFNSYPLDEDAIYARAVFGTKFADRLWGLPEPGFGKPSLDSEGACLIRAYSSRVWGAGIGRMRDAALSESRDESCHFSTEETSCFQRFLDHDHNFQELLRSRNRALRNCVQSVRLQGQCRGGDQFRSCVCNAREELENRLQASLLDCTRKADVGQVYKVLIEGGQRTFGSAKKVHPSSSETLRGATRAPLQKPQHTPPAAPTAISRGVLLHGQCLCACQQNSLQNPPQSPVFPAGRPYMEEVLPLEPSWAPHWYRQPGWYTPEQTGSFYVPMQKRHAPPKEAAAPESTE